MADPLLSIAIPTFNRASMLAHLIAGILPQMTEDVEIVVSDNASADTTPSLMAKLAAENPAIRYFRQEANIGVDRNVDAAVTNATGRFVWICGDDDELEPFAIKHVLGVLRRQDYASGWINYSSWDFDLKECYARRIADVDADILDTDIGGLLSVSHFFFSFVSTHIVRRDLWIAAEARKQCFVPPFTDCIWMLGHLLAGVKGRNFVIARPMLRQRASKYDPRMVAEAPIALNWSRVMNLAVEMGVPAKDIAPFFRETVNGLHLTRNVLYKKQFSSAAARREMFPTIRLFWRYPMFWLTVAPLYILPSSVVVRIQRLYRRARRLGGFRYIEDLSV